MSSLTSILHVNDCIRWKVLNYSNSKKRPNIPKDILIAPSRNLLQPAVFHARKPIDVSSLDLATISKQNGLRDAAQFKAAPVTNHCVSMSLNFIKNFTAHRNIEQAAEAMRHGANQDCARGSMAYEALRHANMYAEEGESALLDKLRNSAANAYGLSLDRELNLNMPLIEMLDYLKNKLAAGEYLIRLPGHIVSLIKNEQGLFLYDSNQGTFDLIKAGEPWFIKFLEKYRINVNERLTLIKVSQKQTESGKTEFYERTEIKSERDLPPQLKYKPFSPASDRWEIAEFTFRDKTYNFVKDKLTGLIYNNNSKKLVHFKFILLTLRNMVMVDTTARTVYHVAMAAINLLKLPFIKVQERRAALKTIIQSTKDIFRAPLYGIVGTGVAFYGIFRPYEGRKVYGYLERCLNRQNDRINWYSKYYVAPCFVPLNFNVEDRNDEEQTMEVLKKYAIRSQSFNKRFLFDLFCGWTKAFNCR